MTSLSRHSALEDWLSWLETQHPKEIDLGLERVAEVGRRLDVLSPSATVITVAGTNGKGSFVATLNALLSQAGQRVGCFTSPHIERYNERVVINGQQVSDQALCAVFEKINEARGDISLTYFEFGTLAAFLLFSKEALDFWVLEIGLGGRLDAVNIVDPDIATITSIDIDHEQWLGDTREKIGAEKAGILRPSIPFVCADENPPESIIRRAERLMCKTYQLGREYTLERVVSGVRGKEEQYLLTLKHSNSFGEAGATLLIQDPQLPIPSIAAAVQVLALCDITLVASEIETQCSRVGLSGRFEQINCGNNTTVVLDVAHNPAAIELFVCKLERYLQACAKAGVAEGKIFAVLGMMKDKNIRQTLSALVPRIDHWFLGEFPGMSRSAKSDELRQELYALGVDAKAISVASDIVSAASAAFSLRQTVANEPLTIVGLGSFVTVADIKYFLSGNH